MSTKRHTMYNLGGAVAPVAMMLLSVPLYLGLVGEARYGVLALVWIVTGYFSFFDFGLGRATAYAIARARDESDDVRAQTFWTALIVNTGFGIAGGLIVLVAAPLVFNEVFNLTPELREELRPVLPWLALAIPLLTFEGVFTGALTGREKFLLLNVRSIIGTAITQFLPLAFVWVIAPTLTVAIPATILARTISVAILSVIAFRSVPAGFRPRFGGRAMVKELLGYGGWVSLGSFLDPIVTNLDRFLIAAYLNVTAVSHYTVPFQLVTRGGLFSRALANALFPRFARSSAAEVERIALLGIRANAALMTILVVAGMMLMRPFLTIWIGSDFAEAAAPVGEQLAISVWLTAIALIPFNVVQARGRPKEAVVALVIQTIPFIAVAIPAVIHHGIIGMAVARNLRSLLNLIILSYRCGNLPKVAKIISVPMAILFATSVSLHMEYPSNSIQLAVYSAIMAACIAYAFVIYPESKNLIRSALGKFSGHWISGGTRR